MGDPVDHARCFADIETTPLHSVGLILLTSTEYLGVR